MTKACNSSTMVELCAYHTRSKMTSVTSKMCLHLQSLIQRYVPKIWMLKWTPIVCPT